MKLKVFNILSVLCCFYSLVVSGQCAHFVDFETQVQLADAIFEGTVIKKESFWNEDHSKILTANYIEVKFNHKTKVPKVIKLITQGGKIGDQLCVVEPSLKLEEGASGCFFTRFRLDKKDWCVSLGNSQSFVSIYNYEQLPVDFSVNLQLHCSKIKPIPTKSLPITITGITPSTVAGGIGQILTISGTGFGTFAPPAKVQFRNPNFFEPTVSYQTADDANIISWTDTQIQIIVPGKDLATGKAGAGSGEIRVVNASGEILQSNQNIIVEYNKATHNLTEIDLINDNGTGGYTFQFGSEFFNNIAAKEAFLRGLDKWVCGTETNFNINEISPASATCATLDGINVVSFDTDCDLPFGTLAETTQWFSFCGNGVTYFDEIDIVFSTGINWNYGPGPTGNFEKDFESIVLHELGHAHGIEHVLNQGETMYPSLADGEQFRSIDTNAKNCAALILDHSSQAINCGSQLPLQATEICEFNVNLTVFLEGAYEDNGLMTNALSTDGLLPNNHPYSANPYNYEGMESNDNLPNNMVDWVLVEARSGVPNNTLTPGTVVEETLVGLLLNNGNIVSADGFTPLRFRNLIFGENYYFAIRHRNHLDILAANPSIATNNIFYDFTNSIESAFGIEQQKISTDGRSLMISGEFNQDGVIQTTDYDQWFAQPAILNAYINTDANLDGVVQTTDFDIWFSNRAKVGIPELAF